MSVMACKSLDERGVQLTSDVHEDQENIQPCNKEGYIGKPHSSFGSVG